MAKESIPEDRRQFFLTLDCRYAKQYHEVSFPVAVDAVRQADAATIARTFHAEHNRMYGYSLEEEGAPIELINVRVRAVGLTEKPAYAEEPYAGKDAQKALKGERVICVPDGPESERVSVYDGHRTRHGNFIRGPALIEQVNTTLLLTSSYDCLCDQYGSFVVFRKGHEQCLSPQAREMIR